MISALLTIFGMVALAGLLDLLQSDTDDDHANNSVDPVEPNSSSGEDYGVDIELQDQLVTLNNFNPETDRLILTTRSLDLDFNFDGSKQTLSIHYGDSSTDITAHWEPQGIGTSVIVRHVSDTEGESVVTDYVLDISGAISPSDMATYFQLNDIIGQSRFEGVGSVVNLGDHGQELSLTGNATAIEGNIWSFNGQTPNFNTSPTLIFRGGAGNDLLTLHQLNTEAYLASGDDSVVMDRGVAMINMGGGNDIVDASKSVLKSDAIVVYGGTGNDLIGGSAGHDFLDGGLTDDFLVGGQGNDVIFGGLDRDSIYGGIGDDILTGSRSFASLPSFGQMTFNDHVDSSVDTIFGGTGDDQLNIDQRDLAFGGAGSDLFKVYFDPLTDGLAQLENFDPRIDELHVNLKLNEEFLMKWGGQSIGNNEFSISAKVEWVQLNPLESKYILQIDGFKVAEAVCIAPPSALAIKVVGIF